ncbi:MAG: serine hydrolase domain-containing protein [Bacteroidota bacterium]
MAFQDTLSNEVDAIFERWDKIDRPGAAVGIIDQGKLIYKKGYGMANLEYDVPITTSTPFHVASLAKQFTAFSILLLQEDGLLNLDDAIQQYIPEIPDFGTTITLRHLITHSSGLRDQSHLLWLAGYRPDDVITKDHVLSLIANQKELNFPAGEESLYSNTGFILLAEVVAKISGRSFSQFTSERIFEPLGMTNTCFYEDQGKILKNRAYSYYNDQEQLKTRTLSATVVGSSNLYTTVDDLAKWVLNFENIKIGSSLILHTMNKEFFLANGEPARGAFGQYVGTYEGIDKIDHDGAEGAFRAYLGRFPNQSFSVIVLSNNAEIDATIVGLRIAKSYLQEHFQTQDLSTKEQNLMHKKLSTKTLKTYEGHYWNDNFQHKTHIYIEKDTLYFSKFRGKLLKMAAISKNEFQIVGVQDDIRLTIVNKEGHKSMIMTMNGSNTQNYEFYEQYNYTDEDWKQIKGNYFSEELQTVYTIKVTESNVIANHWRLGQVELTRLKGDLFSGNRGYFSEVEFVRDSNSNIIGFRVSNGRVRKLLFSKRNDLDLH